MAAVVELLNFRPVGLIQVLSPDLLFCYTNTEFPEFLPDDDDDNNNDDQNNNEDDDDTNKDDDDNNVFWETNSYKSYKCQMFTLILSVL